MTWRETSDDGGVRTIHCSAIRPATPIASVGIAFGALGLASGVFLARLVGFDAVEEWIVMPVLLLLVGAVLVVVGQPGGPSRLTITVGPSELRLTSGRFRKPLSIAPASVEAFQAVVAASVSLRIGVRRTASNVSNHFARVVLYERAGVPRVVACFADERCAEFFANRMTTLLHEFPHAPTTPGMRPFR